MKKIIKEVFLFIFIVAVLCSCVHNSSDSDQTRVATSSNKEEKHSSEETKAKYAPEEFGYKLYDVSEADFSASDIDKMSISFSANYILTKILSS